MPNRIQRLSFLFIFWLIIPILHFPTIFDIGLTCEVIKGIKMTTNHSLREEGSTSVSSAVGVWPGAFPLLGAAVLVEAPTPPMPPHPPPPSPPPHSTLLPPAVLPHHQGFKNIFWKHCKRLHRLSSVTLWLLPDYHVVLIWFSRFVKYCHRSHKSTWSLRHYDRRFQCLTRAHAESACKINVENDQASMLRYSKI